MLKPAHSWVVKLGGSLAGSPSLRDWLDCLSLSPSIIVPGGGPFADAVRKAQEQWHFDELTAHHMAILGMRQYGRMLLGLCPKLLAATTLADFARNQTLAKVWMPSPEALDDAGIPASWDITSDSLAAWLAGQIHAEHLLLVKSVAELGASPGSVKALADAQAAGWVDPAFGHYAMRPPLQCWLCGPDGHAHLPQGFTEPGPAFMLLHP